MAAVRRKESEDLWTPRNCIHRGRELAAAEECIFECNLPPNPSDQEGDEAGGVREDEDSGAAWDEQTIGPNFGLRFFKSIELPPRSCPVLSG